MRIVGRLRWLRFSAALGLVVGAAVAVGAESWSVTISTRFPHSTGWLPVAEGDRLEVTADLRPGPTPPGPTEAKVYSPSLGFSWLLSGVRGTTLKSAVFTVGTGGASVLGMGYTNWDIDDRCYVRVRLLRRPNLVVDGPRVTGDGYVEFGYRVDDEDWIRTSRPNTLKLYYARGGSPVGSPLSTKTLTRTARGSSNSFREAISSFRLPPADAQSFLVVLDADGAVAESNEGDNSASTPLPASVAAVPPQYDAQGGIVMAIDVKRPEPRNVLVQLWYATGTGRDSILREDGPVANWSFPIGGRGVTRATVARGDYRLPPGTATHLLLVVDDSDDLKERFAGEEGDNVAIVAARIAPQRGDYVAVSRARGVGVYRRQVGTGVFVATVVDLEVAALRQLVDETVPGPSYDAWWNRANDEIPVRGGVVAIANMAIFNREEFGYSYRDGDLGWTNSFPWGLKVGGRLVSAVDAEIVANAATRRPVFLALGANDVGILQGRAGYRFLTGAPADPAYPDLVGGIHGGSDNGGVVSRQWVGMRDHVRDGSRGEKRFRTAVLLSAMHRVSHAAMDAEMEAFGVADDEWVQMDGGASTMHGYLRSDGRRVFEYSQSPANLLRGRLPHVFAVLTR